MTTLASPDPRTITCAGTSMTPTVLLGDRVSIAPPRAGVRAGDVLLFETGDRSHLLLHRVVFRLPGTPYFVHRGDAGVGTGIARTDRVLGRAELPPRAATLGELSAGALAVLRYARDAVARRVRN